MDLRSKAALALRGSLYRVKVFGDSWPKGRSGHQKSGQNSAFRGTARSEEPWK